MGNKHSMAIFFYNFILIITTTKVICAPTFISYHLRIKKTSLSMVYWCIIIIYDEAKAYKGSYLFLTDPVWRGPFYKHLSHLFNHSLSQWVILFLQLLVSIPHICWSRTGVTSVTQEVCICRGARDMLFFKATFCNISSLFFSNFCNFSAVGASWWRVCYQRAYSVMLKKKCYCQDFPLKKKYI